MGWSLTVGLAAGLVLGLQPQVLGEIVGYSPDTLLVKPKAGADAVTLAGLYAAQNAQEIAQIHQLGVRVLKVPAAALPHVLSALSHNPNFDFAEPDYLVSPDALPNDPSFASQWHLSKISAPAAWDITTGAGIVIAILDSGVDGTHPDLAANMVSGWNFYDNNANTSDVYGHGTAVAGTAAAAGNNGLGVASLAWTAKIMPIRISDTNGYAYWSTVASGLTYAADHGARVANISFQCSSSSTVSTAAQYFQSKGGVVAVSAGNDGLTDTVADNPFVLTVSATDANDNLASWSHRGTQIDLAAPGVGIVTTCRGGGYGSWSGTSFSAPIVAGAAALVLGANPNLTGDQVQSVLEQSADDLGTIGWDASYGNGRVNVAAAVTLALSTPALDKVAPSVTITSPASGSALAGLVSICAAASDNVKVAAVDFYVDGIAVGTLASAPYNLPWNSASVADGSHTIAAKARDGAGNVTTAVASFTVKNTVDTMAPVVVILSPADGSKITLNNTSVKVQATDNVGVTQVGLYVDSKLVATSATAPFTISWNTKKLSTGTHKLQCAAYDAAGNMGCSAAVTVSK